MKKFFIALLVVIMSATGFITSQKFLAKPPTEEHMVRLATIAEEALNQGYTYSPPEDIRLSESDGTIFVRSSKFNQYGEIQCKPMENGDATFLYDRDKVSTTGCAIITALMFDLFTVVIIDCVKRIVKKRKS